MNSADFVRRCTEPNRIHAGNYALIELYGKNAHYEARRCFEFYLVSAYPMTPWEWISAVCFWLCRKNRKESPHTLLSPVPSSSVILRGHDWQACPAQTSHNVFIVSICNRQNIGNQCADPLSSCSCLWIFMRLLKIIVYRLCLLMILRLFEIHMSLKIHCLKSTATTLGTV